MTQKLYEKYPAIFANRCGLELGDGWSGIINAMCEAMTEAYTTCIYVDANREPSVKDIIEATTNTIPLAQLMDGQIAALRKWANGRARPAAGKSDHDKPVGKTTGTTKPNRRIAGLN